MARFFDPQNSFWSFIAKFADLLMLSIAWLFLSLPVFTLGAATAALYDATAKCVVGGRMGTMVRFWSTFRREFKTGTLATLLWGGLCALLIWGVWALRSYVAFEGVTAALLLAAWFVVLLIPVGAFCWMCPLLSRFTFSLKDLIVTGLRFTFGYFPRTFLVVLTALVAVMVSVWLMVPMLILPGLAALAWVYLMEPVFKRYQPAPPDEDLPEAEEQEEEDPGS